MEYNTEREKIVISEYGRNIQVMIRHLMDIEDRKQRTEAAYFIVNVMAQMNPQVKEYDVSLDSITFPDNLRHIGAITLDECSNLVYCHLPEQLENISEWLLYGTKLETLVVPPHVTRVEQQSLAGCLRLHKVTMPASVTYLGDSLFIDGTQLDTLIVQSTVPPSLGKGVFPNYDAKLFVPAGTIDAYREHPVWGLFLDIFEIKGTAITAVKQDEPTDIYYDLQGRRLATRPQRKGIYIKNGKNVM